MAVVRADALSVVREPGANVLILRGGENDVAVTVIPRFSLVFIPTPLSSIRGVVLDLGERTLLQRVLAAVTFWIRGSFGRGKRTCPCNKIGLMLGGCGGRGTASISPDEARCQKFAGIASACRRFSNCAFWWGGQSDCWRTAEIVHSLASHVMYCQPSMFLEWITKTEGPPFDI